MMSNWKETNVLERDVILTIRKKPKSVTEISRDVKRAKPTISEAVKRLSEQEIVTKVHDYPKDARKSKISVNLKRIKIEKIHTFYLVYFVLSLIPFITCLIFSLISKRYFLIIGCSAGILPPLLFIIYSAYVKADKVIVYKNPKTNKKSKEEDAQKEQDNQLGNTTKPVRGIETTDHL